MKNCFFLNQHKKITTNRKKTLLPPKFQEFVEVFQKKTSVGKKCPQLSILGNKWVFKEKMKKTRAKNARFSIKKSEKNIFQN